MQVCGRKSNRALPGMCGWVELSRRKVMGILNRSCGGGTMKSLLKGKTKTTPPCRPWIPQSMSTMLVEYKVMRWVFIPSPPCLACKRNDNHMSLLKPTRRFRSTSTPESHTLRQDLVVYKNFSCTQSSGENKINEALGGGHDRWGRRFLPLSTIYFNIDVQRLKDSSRQKSQEIAA